MFTHNPTTTGHRTVPRIPREYDADIRSVVTSGGFVIRAYTMTVHAMPERPYVRGRSSQRARNAIQVAYQKWLAENYQPQQ